MSAGGQYERGQEEQTLWYARSCTCGIIIDVLSALEGTPVKGGVGPQAAIEISEEAGLQVRVLEGATLHGSASLKPALFEEWTCTLAAQEPLQFCIHLGLLLDCLRTFSGETSPDRPHSLHLDFRSHPAPCLSLRLVEGISVIDVEVAAIDVEPPPKPPAPSSVPVRVVWGAPLLRDAIQTLETLESGEKDRVHVQLCPKPVLKLTLSSPSMGAELSYPPHIFTCFDVTAEVDFSFRFARVALALRTLNQQGSNVHPSSLS